MTDFLQLVRPQTLDLMQYERVWWDPGHQHFVVLANGVFSALSSSSVPGRGLTRRSRPVEAQGGSGAKLAKYSLDMELLALQVSDTALVVVCVENGGQWRIDCKNSSGSGSGGNDNALLQSGFVWSEHGGNSQDLVLVTQQGVEFHKVSVKRGQCKLSRTLAYSTHAWWYAPEQKLLVLADGLQPSSHMRAWFLKSTVGTNMPRLELPPPDKCPRFALPQAPGMDNGLRPADVALVCLYGDMYLARIHASAAACFLVRLRPREPAVWTHTLSFATDAGSGLGGPSTDLIGVAFELSAADNLLMVHAKAPANRTFLFDIAHRPTTVNPPPTPSSGAAGALAAAPLVPAWKLGGPVARAPDHKTLDPTAASSSSSAASTTATTTRNEDQRGPPENQVALSVNSCRSAGAEFYGAWRLLWPKSALDATGTVGRVWKVSVNPVTLTAATTTGIASPSQFLNYLPTLLRRGQESTASPNTNTPDDGNHRNGSNSGGGGAQASSAGGSGASVLFAAVSTAQAAWLAKGAKLTVLWRLAALLAVGLEKFSENSGNLQEWLQDLATVFSALHAPNASLVHARASSDPKALSPNEVLNYRAARAAYTAAHAQPLPPPATATDLASAPRGATQTNRTNKTVKEYESVLDVIAAAVAKLQLYDLPSEAPSFRDPSQASAAPEDESDAVAGDADTPAGSEVAAALHSPRRAPPVVQPAISEVALLPPPPPPRSSPHKPGPRPPVSTGVGAGVVTDWEASLKLNQNDWPLLESLGLASPSSVAASSALNDAVDATKSAAGLLEESEVGATQEPTTASRTTSTTEEAAEVDFLAAVTAASKAAIVAVVGNAASGSSEKPGSLKSAAPLSGTTSSTMTPRCFASGELVVSQSDVYRCVWAPLAALVLNAKKRPTTIGHVDKLVKTSTECAAANVSAALRAKALVAALIAYLAELRKHKLAVVEHRIPALLVKLLATTNRLQDLVQLVHYKIIPDSTPVALALLTASDQATARAARAARKQNGIRRPTNAVLVSEDGHIVEQLALDCLWRVGESTACVARILASGRFLDATALCLSALRGSLEQSQPLASMRLVHPRYTRLQALGTCTPFSFSCSSTHALLLPCTLDILRVQITPIQHRLTRVRTLTQPCSLVAAHLFRSRLALPPSAFFAAAVAAAQRLPPDIRHPNPPSSAITSDDLAAQSSDPAVGSPETQQQQEGPSSTSSASTSSSSTRVGLFVHLAAFLRAWQPGVLLRDPTTGCSPLSKQVPKELLFSAQDSKDGSSKSPPLLEGASAARVRHLLALDKFVVTK